jgi:hypothetical protein
MTDVGGMASEARRKNLGGAEFNCMMAGDGTICQTSLSSAARGWRINLSCIINANHVAGRYIIILHIVESL